MRGAVQPGWVEQEDDAHDRSRALRGRRPGTAAVSTSPQNPSSAGADRVRQAEHVPRQPDEHRPEQEAADDDRRHHGEGRAKAEQHEQPAEHWRILRADASAVAGPTRLGRHLGRDPLAEHLDLDRRAPTAAASAGR